MENQEDINWHRERKGDDLTSDEVKALEKIEHNYRFVDSVKFGENSDAVLPAHRYAGVHDLKMNLEQGELPAKADLSRLSPEIYAQGDLGSCVSNSLSMAWRMTRLAHNDKSYVRIVVTGYKDMRPSRLYVYFNAKMIEGTPVRSDTGCTVHGALLGVGKNRTCDEEKWGYEMGNFGVQPSLEAYVNASNHSEMSYNKIIHTLDSLKYSISQGKPVMFGAVIFKSCKTRKVMHSGMIPTPVAVLDMPLGGHCMLIVGYDDEKKLFKIQNSWGKIWGDSGFGYMGYEYILNKNFCGDFWSFDI